MWDQIKFSNDYILEGKGAPPYSAAREYPESVYRYPDHFTHPVLNRTVATATLFDKGKTKWLAEGVGSRLFPVCSANGFYRVMGDYFNGYIRRMVADTFCSLDEADVRSLVWDYFIERTRKDQPGYQQILAELGLPEQRYLQYPISRETVEKIRRELGESPDAAARAILLCICKIFKLKIQGTIQDARRSWAQQIGGLENELTAFLEHGSEAQAVNADLELVELSLMVERTISEDLNAHHQYSADEITLFLGFLCYPGRAQEYLGWVTPRLPAGHGTIHLTTPDLRKLKLKLLELLVRRIGPEIDDLTRDQRDTLLSRVAAHLIAQRNPSWPR